MCPFWKPHKAKKKKKASPKEVLEREGEGRLKVERSSSQRGWTETRAETCCRHSTQAAREERQGKKRKGGVRKGYKNIQEKKGREKSQLAQTEILGLALNVAAQTTNHMD